jgi:IclR family KDG regulon transcriptional repressor
MPSDSTKVLSHFIAIVDCFTVLHPEMGVREAARQAGLSPSTAGRLMAELKEAGLLKQNPHTRTYSPGSKVLAWSSVYMATLNIRSAALPYMEELRHTTGETVTLYLLEGNDRLCVERMESHQNIRMVTRVGQKLPLYAGSAGKAILAFMPPEWIEEYLGSVALKPLTSRTISDSAQLRRELEQIRRDGYAASFGEWILEASGVAAPIFGPMGAVLGALSISGPGTRFTPERVEEFAAQARRVTQVISEIMGFNPAI